MKPGPLLTALVLAALATPSPAADISGSDIAGPVVTAALQARAPSLSLDFSGTFDGLADLRAGRAGVVLAFLPDGESPPEVKRAEWAAVAVAFQPVIVAVNSANNATEIDLATLAGLYGENNDTRFDTWRCLPASGLTQGPLAIAPHPGKGVAVSYFRSAVLAGAPYGGEVRFAAGPDDEESRATTTVNAIALLPRPPVSGNLKVLAVADSRPGRSAKAYFPTDSNVHTGDYPLRVPLWVIFRKADTAKVAPAVRALLSDDTAKSLSANGLIPTPENLRKKFAQTLDEAK